MSCVKYVFNTLIQYFEEAPLAAITASSLLRFVCICFAHLDLGIFSHSSLQICPSSVKLDGSVGEQQSSSLSTDSHWDSSLGFGWATQGVSRSCSEAIPVLLCLYDWSHCPVGT